MKIILTNRNKKSIDNKIHVQKYHKMSKIKNINLISKMKTKTQINKINKSKVVQMQSHVIAEIANA